MKELSIKEKAKAYDEAIDKAKKELDACGSQDCDAARQIFRLFPELKESEDERIRKAIINVFATHKDYEIFFGASVKDILAWLEKQGQKSADKVKPKFKVGDTMRTLQEAKDGWTDGMPVVVSIDEEYYHCTNELIAIKDQDDYEFPPINVKHNHADKVEPKFHEGDIIIHKELGGDYIHNPHKIIQVDILDKKYRLEGGLVAHFGEQDDYELVEQKPVWSEEVQEEQVSEEFINVLGAVLNDGLPDRYLVSEERIKKSAELLFSIARKQLNNEMQEWSEEDDMVLNSILDSIQREGVLEKKRKTDWLKFLKGRVQPQPKQEWSEEDEDIKETIIGELELVKKSVGEINYNGYDKLIDWLKSLRPQNRWKPSDEQMRELSIVATGKGWFSKEILSELLEQLKKLREE